MERSNELERLYKELHSGIYSWGEKVFLEAEKVGYIESADGFKLHLPYYKEFKEISDWYRSLDRDFWNKYSLGKKYYTEKNKSPEALPYITEYLGHKDKVSQYFKYKSKYFKLCLNNPIQTTAAHQTKRAAVLLFNYILKNNHIGRVKIANIPHDEFVLHVEESLAEEYKTVLEQCMIQGGNHYLKNGIIETMKAEANIGDNWYEAK